MFFNYFIAGFAGIAGIIIGILVSKGALEEVKEFYQSFRLIRDNLFLFAAAFFFYHTGIIITIISLAMLIIVIHHFNKKEVSNLIALLMMIMLILTMQTNVYWLLCSMFLIIGMVEAGLWSSEHKKLFKKGILSKELWHKVFKDHALYMLLPLAGIVFIV